MHDEDIKKGARNTKPIVFLGVIAVVVLYFVIAGQLKNNIGSSTDQQTIEKGKVLPQIKLKNLVDEEIDIASYKGKIVIINFWATWCTFCDKEMPDFQKLINENEDVAVVAIDVKEDKDVVSNYINKGGYTFDVLLDQDGAIANQFNIRSYPTSYFLNEKGELMGVVKGMMTYPQMVELIKGIRGK